MLDLFNKFSPSEVIIFIILLAIAFKEVFTFFEWLSEKGTKVFKNKYQKPYEDENTIKNLEQNVEWLKKNIKILINSDKDAIKAFITRQHHYFCYQLKEIDDQSLDCIEKRYTHYKEEKGNSYIDSLMEELRALPRSVAKTMGKK